MNIETIKSVYFVGAGGIGMSALVRYFLFKGKVVAGYDRTPTPLTETLISEGAQIHYEENVDRIRQRLKCVKRDADRKRNLRHGKRGFENRIAVLHQKSRVFEHNQPRQIQRHAQRQQRPAPLFFKRQRKAPVERCHRQHQKHIHRLAPGVKHQTRADQDDVFCRQAPLNKVQKQAQRQKNI